MKTIILGAVSALALSLTAAHAQEYPTKEIQGIIQWGAGGSTDTVMRAVTPYAEEILGGTVAMQNMTGGVGAIALNYVADAEADGYTLLMGAENPLLYKVMGLGDKDYGDFTPVNLLARGTPILVANVDAPFDDYAGMMQYIADNPGELKLGATGPGDAVTAIMIGALFIHGLNPGPMLMVDQPHMFWFIVGALCVANCFMLLFGLTGIRLFTRIVEMPRAVLIPLIMLLSIVGAFAVNNAITDVYWMLAFGVLGYFMRHYGYPLGPVILGVILSRLLDDNWRRAIISEREDLGRFFGGILTSPLSLALFAAVILIFVSQTPLWTRAKARLAARAQP